MGITIKKIAELSNVSRGTVDRVLNNKPGVREEVRKKVKEIAEALEYKPNIIGKALVNLKKTIEIGVILAPDYNPFVDEIKKGVWGAFQELYDSGVKIDVEVIRSIDAKEQANILDKLLKDGISAISMVPIEHELIREHMNSIIGKGIPIVTFNSDIKDTQRLCFVGQDHIMGGRVAGGLMSKLLNGKGKIAIIASSLDLLCHKQRTEGFKTKIEEDSKEIEIIKILENQDIEIKAFEQTLMLCEKYGDLKGIYITGGGASGLGKALKVLGKGDEIKVVSHDFVHGTVELVKEKIIDFTIGQDPYRQGYLPIMILYDYLISGKYPDENFIKTNIDIRTEDNIDLF